MHTTAKALVAALLLVPAACERRADNAPSSTGRSGAPPATGPDHREALPRGQTEADRALADAVRRSLSDDRIVMDKAQNILVEAANGVVTLRGQVATQTEKDLIDAKVRVVPGVTRVDNRIDVKTS